MTEPVRLSKRLIALTGCSRREADLYIEGGWVLVDGQVVDQPQHLIGERQQVVLAEGAVAEPVEPATLILNQRAGLDADRALASIRPDSIDPAAADQPRVLKAHLRGQRCLLPLPRGAGGLQVFSQDWRTVRKLEQEAGRLELEYQVDVTGELAPNGFERLKRGAVWKGQALPAVKASWQSENRLRLALKGPAERLIAELCASVGLHATNIRRIRIGGMSMGKLAAGHWRYLAARERF